MGRAENKTTEHDGDVGDFLDSIPDPGRRDDARELVRLMERVTGKPARMWGAGIVGFGRYHYRYPTGREGDTPAASFSPRKAATTVYLMDGVDAHAAALERLGPHTVGKGCLYIKRLGEVDVGVLEGILRQSYRSLVEHTIAYHQGERGSGKHPS